MAEPVIFAAPSGVRNVRGPVTPVTFGTPPVVVSRPYGEAWYHDTSVNQSTISFGPVADYLGSGSEYTWFFEVEFPNTSFIDYPVAHLSAIGDSWDLSHVYAGVSDAPVSPRYRVAVRHSRGELTVVVNGVEQYRVDLWEPLPIDGVLAYYAKNNPAAHHYSGVFMLYDRGLPTHRLTAMTHPSHPQWTWTSAVVKIGGVARDIPPSVSMAVTKPALGIGISGSHPTDTKPMVLRITPPTTTPALGRVVINRNIGVGRTATPRPYGVSRDIPPTTAGVGMGSDWHQQPPEADQIIGGMAIHRPKLNFSVFVSRPEPAYGMDHSVPQGAPFAVERTTPDSTVPLVAREAPTRDRELLIDTVASNPVSVLSSHPSGFMFGLNVEFE